MGPIPIPTGWQMLAIALIVVGLPALIVGLVIGLLL